MAIHRLQCPKNIWCFCGGPAFVGGLGKHRPGTKWCDSHPLGPLQVALRGAENKEDEEDIIAAWAFETRGKKIDNDNIPF